MIWIVFGRIEISVHPPRRAEREQPPPMRHRPQRTEKAFDNAAALKSFTAVHAAPISHGNARGASFLLFCVKATIKEQQEFTAKCLMSLRSSTRDEICARHPNSLPPNVLIGGPVRNSPGFPLKAYGNDKPEIPALIQCPFFKGGARSTKVFVGCGSAPCIERKGCITGDRPVYADLTDSRKVWRLASSLKTVRPSASGRRRHPNAPCACSHLQCGG